MARKRDGGWRLPDPAVPVGRRCVTLDIPDDQQHIANFWGAIQELARASNYDASKLTESYDVAQMWREIIENARVAECGGSMSCQDVLDCLDDQPAWQQISNAASSDFSLSNEQIEQITQEQAAAREAQYDGTPQSIMNDPTYDQTGGSWGANPAWCEGASAWVQAVFAAKLRQLDQMAGIAQVASLLLTGLKTLSGGGWLLNLAGWGLLPLDLFLTYNRDVMYPLLTDPQILFHTIDGIVRENSGKAITFAGYQQLTGNGYAWRDTTYPGMAFIKQWLNAEVLHHAIQGERNYQLLLQAVHTANYHKEALGDPMWCGRTNSWTLKRGKDYALTGVQVITGSVDTVNGFKYYASGINRKLEILLTSPTPTVFKSFRLTGTNRTPSPNRPTELTILNNGVAEYENTNNFPNDSDYYYNINSTGNWLRFYGYPAESGQWTIDDPYYKNVLTVTGNDQPPVGYWTPD